MQGVTLRRFANGGRIPPGGFDQDIARLFRDHGVVAAHDARQAYGLFRIGDYQVFRSEFAFDASRVFSVSPARAKRTTMLAAFEQVEIEDVGGFADLLEDVVGGIDCVVDRARVEQERRPVMFAGDGLIVTSRITRAVKRGQ